MNKDFCPSYRDPSSPRPSQALDVSCFLSQADSSFPKAPSKASKPSPDYTSIFHADFRFTFFPFSLPRRLGTCLLYSAQFFPRLFLRLLHPRKDELFTTQTRTASSAQIHHTTTLKDHHPSITHSLTHSINQLSMLLVDHALTNSTLDPSSLSLPTSSISRASLSSGLTRRPLRPHPSPLAAPS